MPTTETIYYFGHRRTPHQVTRVIPTPNNNQSIAIVYLRGPRGGESRAFVRANGSCRKI